MINTEEYGEIEFEPETKYIQKLYRLAELHNIEIRSINEKTLRLKFKDHVGFLSFGNQQINIRPKFPLASFLYVLARSSLELKTLPSSLIQTGQHIEDFNVVRIFSSLLKGFLKIGLGSDYVTIIQEIPYIMGNINFSDINSFYPWNIGKLPCIYDDFTVNNKYNQIVRFTLNRLKKISSQFDKPTFIELLRLDERLVKISLNQQININFIDYAIQNIPRRFEYYRPILALCKLILSGLSINEIGKSIHITGFILRMNILYESFVFSLTKLYLPNYVITSRKYVMQSKPGSARYLLYYRPDVVAKNIDKSSPILVGDAKYKYLDYQKERLEIQSDFYQILSYCLFMKAKKGILFYPNPSLSLNNPIIFRLEEYGVEIWIVSLQLGGSDWTKMDHNISSLFDEIKKWINTPELIKIE